MFPKVAFSLNRRFSATAYVLARKHGALKSVYFSFCALSINSL